MKYFLGDFLESTKSLADNVCTNPFVVNYIDDQCNDPYLGRCDLDVYSLYNYTQCG